MMQSSLATRRIASSMIAKRIVPLWVRSSSSVGRTADPGVHAGQPEGLDAEEAERGAVAQQTQRERELDEGIGAKQPPQKPPTTVASSPKLETSDVNTQKPFKQQKRRYSDSRVVERRREADRRQKDDQEYYKDHKASPLSEVEFADTRKPVSQATDGTATNKVVGGDGGIITWKEEQLESAEETLMRTMRMWRETAMKGDPDAPHSRALRAALRARGDPVDF